MEEDKRVLLHVCCGPCSTSSILRLLEEGYKPVLFYSNSNIYPESEFIKREGELEKVASLHSLDVIVDGYDHEAWREKVKGLECEKEGGARCPVCFRYNLERTCRKAKELGIPYFTTTLTVSRFKPSKVIFAIGRDYPGFLEIDFKKKGGFEKSVRLSKEMGLYRQEYCGCEFSLGKENG